MYTAAMNVHVAGDITCAATKLILISGHVRALPHSMDNICTILSMLILTPAAARAQISYCLHWRHEITHNVDCCDFGSVWANFP